MEFMRNNIFCEPRRSENTVLLAHETSLGNPNLDFMDFMGPDSLLPLLVGKITFMHIQIFQSIRRHAILLIGIQAENA